MQCGESITRASSVARVREHQGVLGADVRNSDAGGGGPGPGGVGHMREGGRELSPRYMREGGRELMREGGREGGRELSPRYMPLAPGNYISKDLYIVTLLTKTNIYTIPYFREFVSYNT